MGNFMKTPGSKIYALLGMFVVLGYLWFESTGVVFGGTDTRSAAFWSDGSSSGGPRSTGWGYWGGSFGGK
jgi:hypothetical protein